MADLIYTDINRNDVGVLMKYTLDLDVAEGKDFQLKAAEHILDIGCYWYIAGTEYGGIVDSFMADEDSQVVTYEGRNYRGMLENKVIEPPTDYDYYIADGNLQTVLNGLFEACGCNDLFTADETDVEVLSFQFERYTDLYAGITKMADEYNYNLVYTFSNVDCKVHVEAVLAADYSEYLEYCKDNSIKFTVGSNAGKCNHLICLGRGELADRKVIHLFTDENGGVQPYSTKDIPLQDSDYILDKRNQLLIGIDEKVQVYDYSSAEIAYNYIRLTSQPSNWSRTYGNYYVLNDDRYEAAESTTEDVYTLLTSQPSNWSSKYGSYYKKSGSNYNNVEANENISYVKQTRKPKDWAKKWKNYYFLWSDGVTSEYRETESVSYNIYKKQTRKPYDWADNFSSYYMKKTVKKKTSYVAVDYVSYKDKSGKKKRKKPVWSKNKYYTQFSREKAPAWKKNYYYNQIVKHVAPPFAANTYYSLAEETIIPAFSKNKYYKQVEDNFATLVEGGIDKLAELTSTNSQTVDLDEFECIIGDTVGGTDDFTGLTITEKVTNMIVKSVNGHITIEYKIGGN